jgi:hypothetical protein
MLSLKNFFRYKQNKQNNQEKNANLFNDFIEVNHPRKRWRNAKNKIINQKKRNATLKKRTQNETYKQEYLRLKPSKPAFPLKNPKAQKKYEHWLRVLNYSKSYADAIKSYYLPNEIKQRQMNEINNAGLEEERKNLLIQNYLKKYDKGKKIWKIGTQPYNFGHLTGPTPSWLGEVEEETKRDLEATLNNIKKNPIKCNIRSCKDLKQANQLEESHDLTIEFIKELLNNYNNNNNNILELKIGTPPTRTPPKKNTTRTPPKKNTTRTLSVKKSTRTPPKKKSTSTLSVKQSYYNSNDNVPTLNTFNYSGPAIIQTANFKKGDYVKFCPYKECSKASSGSKQCAKKPNKILPNIGYNEIGKIQDTLQYDNDSDVEYVVNWLYIYDSTTESIKKKINSKKTINIQQKCLKKIEETDEEYKVIEKYTQDIKQLQEDINAYVKMHNTRKTKNINGTRTKLSKTPNGKRTLNSSNGAMKKMKQELKAKLNHTNQLNLNITKLKNTDIFA